MVKQGVVPDELTAPFWDAANQSRLVIQKCSICNRLQHPPEVDCKECGSSDDFIWEEMSGRGKVYNFGVIHDCPVRLLQDDQPFNLAVVMLDEDPGIQMYSHMPGVEEDQVPVGANVRAIFEKSANGQLIPEWEVVD
jgi:uncharacterized OB-fold protein